MPELFKRVHEHQLSHPSEDEAFAHFIQEWTTFIVGARHGMFDGYQASKEYPITENAIANSDYINREIYEKQLYSAIQKHCDTVLLGNEGSGKTTLVHYVLGHLSYKEDGDNLIRIYVDTRALNLPTAILTSSIFAEIYTQLARLKIGNASIGDIISQEYRQWLQSKPLLQPLLDSEPQLNNLAALIAYLAVAFPEKRIFVVIDNVDSLNPAPLRELIQYAEALRAASVRILKLSGAAPDGCSLRFIFPCRTSTWTFISNSATGHIPFNHPQMVTLDESAHSVWDLTKKFIKANRPKGETFKIYARSLAFSVPLKPGVTYSWTQNADDALVEIIDWIQDRCPTAEGIIAGFAGHSLRRQKMYALKVLGHAAVVRSWARVHLGESGKHSREVRGFGVTYSHEAMTAIVKEALFDAMQSFGDGMVATEILLNPFGAVRDKQLRLQNPFIGIHLIQRIRDSWDAIHARTFSSDQINIEPVIEHLKAIGYEPAAICQCIESFCMSGVLRPIKSDIFLIEGKRELQNVTPLYIVDKDALDLYHRLVYRTGKETPDDVASKENAILFMNACTRANYGVGYATRFESQIYKAYVNLTFLKDVQTGDAKLARRAQEAGFRGPLQAYVPQVFPSLKRKWQPELDRIASVLHRHCDDLEKEMCEKAKSLLDDLTSDSRNGRMKPWLIEKGE